jgi:anti-sigma-K factor RskA
VARELSHADVQALLGAFALDAVEADEADVVELHLRECPRCRAEVQDHREVAALFAQGGSPAPDGLWDRIAAELEEPPPDLDLRRVARPRGADGSRARGLPRMALVTAAAAAVVIGVLGLEVARIDRRLSHIVPRPAPNALEQAATDALVDPRSRRVVLRSVDGGHTAQLVVLPSGQGYVVRADLPALSATETYQLWALADHRAVSLGVLGRQPTLAAFHLDPSGITTLAVSTERAGGVPTPEHSAVVTGPFTASP